MCRSGSLQLGTPVAKMGCKVFLEMNRVASRAVGPTAGTLYNFSRGEGLGGFAGLDGALGRRLGRHGGELEGLGFENPKVVVKTLRKVVNYKANRIF